MLGVLVILILSTLAFTVCEEDVGTTEDIIQGLQNKNFYDTYKECSRRTQEVFGCDWTNNIQFKSDDPVALLKSVPFAYAVEYRCEARGIGTIRRNGVLQDKSTCIKAMNAKISDEFKSSRDGYLDECQCYEDCKYGGFTSPHIVVEAPTPEEEYLLTEEEIAESTEVYLMEMCGRRCAWSSWTDLNEVQWDTKIYKYFCNSY